MPRSITITKLCVDCREPFAVHLRGASRKCRCASCQRNYENALNRERKRLRQSPQAMTCPTCGKPFMPHGPQKYCAVCSATVTNPDAANVAPVPQGPPLYRPSEARPAICETWYKGGRQFSRNPYGEHAR